VKEGEKVGKHLVIEEQAQSEKEWTGTQIKGGKGINLGHTCQARTEQPEGEEETCTKDLRWGSESCTWHVQCWNPKFDAY